MNGYEQGGYEHQGHDPRHHEKQHDPIQLVSPYTYMMACVSQEGRACSCL